MKTIKITKNIFSPKRVLPKFFILSNAFLFSATSVSLATFTLFNSSFVYADNLDYNVVVKPSLKLTLSSTNPSLNLNPANHTFDTTSLTATVATNYTNGYKLYLDTTSGSGGASNTELVNTTNSTYTIPTLASSSTSSSFPANYWGYKLDSASTEYLSYVPNTLISQSATNTNGTSSSIDFAAKIDYEKPAGLYSIAFDLKTIPIVTQVYMQDMTAEQCTETPTIVIDKRDERLYTIRKIADTCWMIDNLRFTGASTDAYGTMTLDSSTSNIAAEYTTASPQTINYGDSLIDEDSRSIPELHVGTDNNNHPTVWYNYTTASANTILGDGNSNPQIYDICPKGWKLPTIDNLRSLATQIDLFNPVMGGAIFSQKINWLSRGDWWSSTVYGPTARYIAYYKTDVGLQEDPGDRSVNRYIRCILQE